ncbi:MAG: leucyl aminopeptidase, partial [Azoarcus sp.]|nr:leucyl aminopeptidase [Azoarcus sp.]
MEFTIKTAAPEKLRTGLLVLGVFTDAPLPPASRALDEACHGKLSGLISSGELDAKAGSSLLLHGLAGIAAERLLLVSLGTSGALSDNPWRDALNAMGKALAATPAKDGAILFDDATLPPGRDFTWALRQASRIVADSAYRFEALYAESTDKKKAKKERGARKIAFLVSGTLDEALEEAVRHGQAIAEGMALAKDLANLGANVCTPSYLADTVRALGKQFKFDLEILDRDGMEKLGMGALLSVARGARQEPRFIVMRYS